MISPSKLSALSCEQISAERLHCQTMALQTGRPVLLSHTTTVSRWLAIAAAAISFVQTPAFAHGFAHCFKLCGQDIEGVVLDPAGLRVYLPEFPLRQRYDVHMLVKNNRSRTGGSLVQR